MLIVETVETVASKEVYTPYDVTRCYFQQESLENKNDILRLLWIKKSTSSPQTAAGIRKFE